MKTHYEIVFSGPDESDPEGWSEIACRLPVVEKMTKYTDQVTCKNCLKVIQKRYVAELVKLGDCVGGVRMTSDRQENLELIKNLLIRSKKQ